MAGTASNGAGNPFDAGRLDMGFVPFFFSFENACIFLKFAILPFFFFLSYVYFSTLNITVDISYMFELSLEYTKKNTTYLTVYLCSGSDWWNVEKN